MESVSSTTIMITIIIISLLCSIGLAIYKYINRPVPNIVDLIKGTWKTKNDNKKLLITVDDANIIWVTYDIGGQIERSLQIKYDGDPNKNVILFKSVIDKIPSQGVYTEISNYGKYPMFRYTRNMNTFEMLFNGSTSYEKDD